MNCSLSKYCFALLGSCCLLLVVAVVVQAQTGGSNTSGQSDSRYAPASPGGSANRGSATQGSASQGPGAYGSAARDLPVAMRGFCAVCLVEMKKWVRGNPQFRAAYDGRVYYFPEQKQLQMFQAAPEKYVPALGGDCVVHFASLGQRVAGDLNYGARHRGRIYFFTSPQHKETFLASPQQYEDVDLALDGECVVCKVEMNQRMPGQPQVTLVHKGVRYQFAGAEQRNMFVAAPEKYLHAAQLAGSATRGGSDSRGSDSRGSDARGGGTRGSRTKGSESRGSDNRGSDSR